MAEKPAPTSHRGPAKSKKTAPTSRRDPDKQSGPGLRWVFIPLAIFSTIVAAPLLIERFADGRGFGNDDPTLPSESDPYPSPHDITSDEDTSTDDGDGSNFLAVGDLDPGLAQRGIDVADVRAIASVATRTGYGISLETTLTWTQAQDIAYVLSDRCRDVAMGVQTWQGAIAEDINDGAPASDARAMNDYLRSVWCSTVD